jgi:hypothetical protein
MREPGNGNAGATPEGRPVRCDHMPRSRTLTPLMGYDTVRGVAPVSGPDSTFGGLTAATRWRLSEPELRDGAIGFSGGE